MFDWFWRWLDRRREKKRLEYERRNPPIPLGDVPPSCGSGCGCYGNQSAYDYVTFPLYMLESSPAVEPPEGFEHTHPNVGFEVLDQFAVPEVVVPELIVPATTVNTPCEVSSPPPPAEYTPPSYDPPSDTSSTFGGE